MSAQVIVHDVEVAAEKLLSFLGKAEKVTAQSPKAIAALGTLLGAAQTAIQTAAADAANPTLQLTSDTINDLKAVWPDVVALAASLGIKL